MLPDIPAAYSKIIEDTIALAKEHNISVCFQEEKDFFPTEIDIACVGYFDSAERKLVVCITDDWVELLYMKVVTWSSV